MTGARKRMVAAGLLIGLIVFIAIVGVAWANGLNVGNALRMLFVTPRGETIDPAEVPYYEPKGVRWLGNLDNLTLSEVSGLASSVGADGVLWAVNDSGNPSRLFAVSPSGDHLGSWRVNIPQPADWEALAAFVWEGEPYILIADVGDNFRWRRVLRLYAVREPDLDRSRDDVLEVAWWFRFRYPDGYRDCEAVAVDASTGQVLLVSKRVIPAEVYSVPVKPQKAVVTAVRVALLNGIPQPVARDVYENAHSGATRSRPTGLDIVGNRAVLTTNKDAYLFERGDTETWGDAFAGIPRRIALPPVFQREAVALARDGSRFYTVTERPRGTDAVGIFEIEL